MQRIRSMLVVVLGGLAVACGGSATGLSDNTSTNANTSGGRTMTASYNGVAFKPNVLTSAYLGGQVGVNASDGVHILSINANNVTAIGKYSVSAGNANSGLAQWIDNTGSYSSLFTGGGGTVTFTVLQLGRVAGSFDVVVKNTATGSAATMTLTGTFDIKFP